MTMRAQGGSGDEAPRTLARGEDSRLVEARRFVIRDPQAFAAIWTAHAGSDAAVPRVDFDADMVVAVFAGERPTPGFGVTVTGSRREADALVITVTETTPDGSGVVAQVLTSPYHVARLPRDDGEIRFDPPDPTGHGTIIFKPQKRGPQVEPLLPTSQPPPAMSSSADAETTRLTERPSGQVERVDRDERSSTGLSPEVAATLAYLAGPFSGALLLASEPDNRFVRFHAWQAVFALGALGAVAFICLVLAFALLIVSPTAFWVMLWLSAIAGVVWVAAWTLCVVQAYKGRVWKLPLAGDYAARRVA
jgi:uncharacterized membrane protein